MVNGVLFLIALSCRSQLSKERVKHIETIATLCPDLGYDIMAEQHHHSTDFVHGWCCRILMEQDLESRGNVKATLQAHEIRGIAYDCPNWSSLSLAFTGPRSGRRAARLQFARHGLRPIGMNI